MLNLPPGVTDSMCDGDDPRCQTCFHLFSDHYDTDEKKLEITGDTILACDILVSKNGDKFQCDCKEFKE